MAIKSKNSRKIRVVKIISVILAFLTGAFLLFSGGIFVMTWFNYSSQDFSAADLVSKEQAAHADRVYFNTTSGQNDIQNAAYALNEMVNTYRSDDYFYNTYLPERSAQTEQEYQRDMESYIQQHMEQGAPIYDESGSYTSAYEYWKNAYESTYESLEQQIGRITEEYERCQMLLRGFSVYAVNPSTGASYTNVPGDEPTATILQMPYAARYTCADRTLERTTFPWETTYAEETTKPYTQVDGTFETETAGSEPFFTPVEAYLDYMDLAVDFYIGADLYALRETTEWVDTDFFYSFTNFEIKIAITSAVAPYMAACAVIFAVSFVLALCCAGRGPLPEAGTEEYRRKVERFGGTITGREPVLRNGLDAIPNDLYLLLGVGLAVCAGIGFLWAYDRWNWANYVGPFATLMLFSLAAAAFLLETCMSTARNAKTGNYWSHTLIASVGRGFKRMGRWFKCQFSPLGYHFKSLPRYILRLLTAYFVVMIPLSLIPFLPIFINIFVVLFLWRSMASLDRLMKYAHEIQSGNLDVTIDTSKFPKWMVPFADDIIHLRDGMQAAVDEALRSERLKTELITNVSHDLKTPLTSIINYTGLLAKCDIPDPQARDYIAVLQNKSDRLKHLIEDLVEASKASTGNVEFHPVRLNLYEMAVQAVGENEDALANQGVTVVINTPQEQPVVWADSQKTWRVVENLLSNVRKYSVPGTRAYIDVHTEGTFGMLTVKNISREELNISPEELMERFVRGDESRSTEGNGLGLSIAQNLCEKQGGTFRIDIDGDLFKATVRLPLAPVQPAPAAAPLPDGLQP